MATEFDSPDFDAAAHVAGLSNQAQQLDAKQTAETATAANKDGGVWHWVKNLPKNIDVGLMDAAVNTLDSMDHFGRAVVQNAKVAVGAAPDASQRTADSTAAARAAGAPDPTEITPPPALPPNPAYDAFKTRFMEFRNAVAMNQTMVTPMGSYQSGDSRTSDDVTQGIAQFALPFMAWQKLLGGVSAGGKLMSMGRAAVADAATSMTVLQPHDPRMADLVQLGKQSEGKLGEVLNTLAPDGSLMNKYIDFMTDRENESESAGRLKNALDSFTMGAAVTGVLESGIVGLKLGRQVLESTPKVGPGAQGGHLTFHGTPYKFDAFDSSKIGTGEGAQVYGHGLYFAEEKGVAAGYRRTLAPKLGADVTFQGKPVDMQAITDLAKTDPHASSALLAVNEVGAFPGETLDSVIANLRNAADDGAADWLEKNKANVSFKAPKGMLAHVEIPDEHVAKMMLWDKPLSEQPGVLAALHEANVSGGWTTGAMGERRWLSPVDAHDTGASAYKKLSQLLGSDRAASELLAKHGVPGIRYLDAGSRTPNIMEERLFSLLDKHKGDAEAATDEFMRSVYDTPKQKAKTREGILALAKKGRTHNIVLFDPSHAKIVKKE